MIRWKCTRFVLIVLGVLAGVACNQGPTMQDKDGSSVISLFRWGIDIDGQDTIGEFIAEKFNVHFEIESPPWDGWHERLMTRIATGDAPDVFVGYGPMDGPTYRQWISEELILPIDGYLSAYPNLEKYLSRYERQQVDGQWYSIPVEDVSDHVMIVRADWLEELNLSMPETLADLREAAQAMRDRYGIIPITSSAPHTAGFFWLNAIFYAHGSRWSDWVWSEQEGWIPSWIADESKEAISFLRELYRDGLLDPDFLINSDLRKRELFATGEAGIVFHNQVDLYADSLSQYDPGARLEIAPPPAGPGGRGMWGLDGYFSAIMLSSDIEPEKRDSFFELLDFMHSKQGETLFRIGIEDRHFTNTATGPRQISDERPLTRVAPHAQLRYLRALEWLWTPPWHPDEELLSRAIHIGEQYGVPPRFENVVTDAAERYQAQLLDIVYAAYAEMIASQQPIESLWTDFVERYRANGGAHMIEELNARVGYTAFVDQQ